MGYFLLWVEALAAALAWTALFLVLAARLDRRIWRWGLPVLACLPPLAAVVLWLLQTAYMEFVCGFPSSWFGYALGWAVAVLGGQIFLLLIGRRREAAAADQPAVRRAARWPLGRLGWSLGGALLLFTVTLHLMDRAVLDFAAGLRLEAGALAASAAPPQLGPAENAAPLYWEAFAQREALEKEWRERDPEGFNRFAPMLNDGYEPEKCSREEAAGILARYAGILALLRRAAARPGCSFERDWLKMGIATSCPELPQIRESARLLSFSAAVQVARGEPAAALADLDALGALAEHEVAEPLLLGQLVGMAIEGIRRGEMQRFLATVDGAPLDVPLRPEEGLFSFQRTLGRALIGEEAFGVVSLCQDRIMISAAMAVRDFIAPGWDFVPRPYILQRVFWYERNLADYRARLHELQELAGRPYPEIRAAQEERQARKGKSHLLGDIMLSSWEGILIRSLQADACRRVTVLARATLAFRARNNGAWPGSLEELAAYCGGFIPLDPFDGRPIRFSPRGPEGRSLPLGPDGRPRDPAGVRGLVLYSIGPDGDDDQGDRDLFNIGTQHPFLEGDIALRLGSAAKK